MMNMLKNMENQQEDCKNKLRNRDISKFARNCEKRSVPIS